MFNARLKGSTCPYNKSCLPRTNEVTCKRADIQPFQCRDLTMTSIVKE